MIERADRAERSRPTLNGEGLRPRGFRASDRPMSAPTRISPKEASDKLADGWTYVDVRTTQEFEAGHPAGALNVPLMMAGGGGMTPNPDFMRVFTAAFAKDAKIIVGCKAGGRSLRAAQMLLAEGFANILESSQSSLPLETSVREFNCDCALKADSDFIAFP